MPVIDHIHKYRRNKVSYKYTIYQCMLPDCTHFLPADRILGKKNVCWVCGNTHLIYQDTNGIPAKPHCKGCTKTKKKKEEIFDLPPFNIPTILP